MSPQKYIVVFKDSVTKEEIEKYANGVTESGGSISRTFDSKIMKGFAGKIPQAYFATLQGLQGGIIDYIEPDSEVTTQ